MRSRGGTGIWALLVILAVVFVASPVLPLDPFAREVIKQVVYIAPFLAACVGAALASRRARGAERRFWIYMSGICFILFVNDGYVALGMLLTGRSIVEYLPPSLPGALAMLAVALFATMLLSMTRIRRATWVTRLRYFVDLLLLGFVASGVIERMLVAPLLSDIVSSQSTLMVAALYSTAGVLVLVGIFASVFGVRMAEWRTWEALVASGVALYGVGVTLWPMWFLATVYSGDASAPVVEFMWMTGQSLIFAGSVRRLADERSVRELPPAPAVRIMATGRLGWITPLPIIVFASVLGLVQWSSPGRDVRMAAMMVGTACVLLLARSAMQAFEIRTEVRARSIDALTGLEGHRRLRERLAEELGQGERESYPVSVVVFDVDDLRAVNELRGRSVADEVLRHYGAALSEALADHALYRLSGDDFALVLPRFDAEAAVRLALRAKWEVEAANVIADAPGLSAGIAAFPQHAGGAEQLLAFAAGAAHAAKTLSADRVSAHSDRTGADVAADSQPYVRMLRRLARTIDARDGGAPHGPSVAALAETLARRMLLSEERIALVTLAAELHDLGKIALPDALLTTDGFLGGEVAAIREHPALGARMLAAEPLRALVPWVVAHHEAWDGSGYPRGLSGEEIPLEARIIAVCDAYDRLTASRPGAAPLSHAEALETLGQERGRRFDPVIVEQFFYALSSHVTRERPISA